MGGSVKRSSFDWRSLHFEARSDELSPDVVQAACLANAHHFIQQMKLEEWKKHIFCCEFWMCSFLLAVKQGFCLCSKVIKGPQWIFSFYCWTNIQLNHWFILPSVSKYWSSPPKTHRIFPRLAACSPYLQRQGSFFLFWDFHISGGDLFYDCLPRMIF